MRYLVCVLLVLLPGCQLGISDPAPTVRLLTTDGKHVCSAVVIKPEVALTAKHCVDEPKLAVDGFAVTGIAPGEGDVATLTVPGLQCPCAPIGKRPAIGSKAHAIGFPGTHGGVRRVTPEAFVYKVGAASEIFPWLEIVGTFIYTLPSVLSPGDSGGGLFQWQGGGWRLIGINSHVLYSNPFIPLPHVSGFVLVTE